MHLIYIYLFYLLSNIGTYVWANEEKSNILQCKSVNGSIFDEKAPENREGELTFCKEHAARTCCSLYHAQQLKKKIQLLESSKFEISQDCLLLTKIILCSVCDGDIGQRLRKGICKEVCIDWFQQCQSEYFTHTEVNRIDFCSEDSISCWNLNTSEYSTPTTFCEQMGFSVHTDKCYDYLPASKTKGPLAKNVSNKEYRGKVDWGFWDYIKWSQRVLVKCGFYLVIVTFIITVFFCIMSALKQLKRKSPNPKTKMT